MSVCKICGKKLPFGEKHCPNCTTHVYNNENNNARKTVYEGEIRKCPMCGKEISAMQAFCPDCGFELTGKSRSEAMDSFVKGLTSLQNDLSRIQSSSNNETQILAKNREIVNYISTYQIPNTVQDIMEFMLMASTRVKYGESMLNNMTGEEFVFDAWQGMVKRCYEKAKLSISNDERLKQIEEIYKSTVFDYKRISAQSILFKKRSIGKTGIRVSTIAIIIGIIIVFFFSIVGMVSEGVIEPSFIIFMVCVITIITSVVLITRRKRY